VSERPTDGGLLQCSRTADALDFWRAGERNVTRRTSTSEWRDAFEVAVNAALTYFKRHTTMAELVYVMWNQGTPVCLPER